MIEKIKKIVKNPLKLALKLYILIWIVLVLHITLKLTFNYWQPYIIPTSQLENISNFIDNNRWLEIICNGILYVINSLVAILCGVQRWKFKNKFEFIWVLLLIIICFILNITLKLNDYTIIVSCFLVPLIINYRKWLWIILTFVASFIFLALSLWLEGFVNTDDMNYIIKLFFEFDYYIMLVSNYILFNLIRMKKEKNKMGESFWISWFKKPLSELYAIKETRFDELSEPNKEALLKAIEAKENEIKEKEESN